MAFSAAAKHDFPVPYVMNFVWFTHGWTGMMGEVWNRAFLSVSRSTCRYVHSPCVHGGISRVSKPPPAQLLLANCGCCYCSAPITPFPENDIDSSLLVGLELPDKGVSHR